MSNRLDGELTLWIAMILIGTGGVMALVGSVVASIYVVSPTAMAVTTLTPTVVGALVLLLWSALCRHVTACSVILAALNFAGPAIAFFAVAAAVLALAAGFGGISGLHFFVGASLLQSALWGLMQWGLYRVAVVAMCLSRQAISSSMSTSPVPTDSGPKGLGDYVQIATKAIGIQPCASCDERARRLNALTQRSRDRD
jgi:hypothetical protein